MGCRASQEAREAKLRSRELEAGLLRDGAKSARVYKVLLLGMKSSIVNVVSCSTCIFFQVFDSLLSFFASLHSF